MSNWINIIFIAILVALNGYFCLSEVALVAARRSRLQLMIESGNKAAERAIRMHKDPTSTLATVQTGMTIIAVVSGIVGESALADPVAKLMIENGINPALAHPVCTVVVVFIISYFEIVFGELVPKRIAQGDPERIFTGVSASLRMCEIFLKPFIKLLSWSTDAFLRLVHLDKDSDQGVTEEEIHAILEEGSESGVIEANERDMVRNVFRLEDRQVGSVMTPRSDIEWIDISESIEDNIKKLLASNHARMLVAENSLENVKGIISVRSLLKQILDTGKADFIAGAHPVVYVPESLSAMDVLEEFKKNDAQLALVVDEYGEVVGLVTPLDVLEAIAGEFKPKQKEDALSVREDDGSFQLDGILAVVELKDLLKIKELPDEEKNVYNTLSGLFMYVLQRMPKMGDRLTLEGWELEVMEIEHRRISRVHAKRVQSVA